MSRSLLLVKQRIPFPVETGSDAVSYALLCTLKDAFKITLVTVDRGPRSAVGAEHIRKLGIETVLAPPDRSLGTHQSPVGSLVRNARLLFAQIPRNLQSQACRSFGPTVQKLTAERTFALAQFEYWSTAPYRRFASCPAALLNHDVWHLTIAEQARYERSLIARLLWKIEAAAVKRYEIDVQSQFEWRLFLSEEDRRAIMENIEDDGRVAVLPVPFPFAPQEAALVDTGPVVLFIGAMNVEFNIDGVCHFVDRIWPHVRRAVPDAVFVIAGRNPTERVLHLATRPGIRIESRNPDIDALLRQTRVSVSPSRFGTGIKVKVAQALAAGVPVVGTSAGLAGFSLAECLVRADDEQEFADEVVRLLQDATYHKRQSRACYEFYRENLWLDAARPKIVALYERMIAATEPSGLMRTAERR
jgi:glycosyltransferase involved in cell wall biosynthesis